MRVLDVHVVHRNPHPSHAPESYSGTAVAAAPTADGSVGLVCAFRIGSARMSPDGRIACFTSTDLGRTWTRERSPLDPSIDLPSAASSDGTPGLAGSQVGASDEGTVVLGAARMWIVAPGSPAWDDETSGLDDADSVIVRRSPTGAWESPIVLEGRRHEREWAIPCGPPLALGGGRWLYPHERHARRDVPDWLRGYHAFAALSDDDGRSWPELVPLLDGPDGRLAHYDQRCALLPDGRLLSLAWVHDVVEDRSLTARAGWSEDGGRSWSASHDTGIVGGPVNPVVLPDGRVLAVYARRTAPRGVRACLSKDGGRTWALDRELVIFDEASGEVVGQPADAAARAEDDPSLWASMWGWTFGQPMPTLLPGGEVGVAFFGLDPARQSLVRFVRLDPDA